MITDLRPFIGLKDPCRPYERDRYTDRLYKALVLRNLIRRAAAKARHTHGWFLANDHV